MWIWGERPLGVFEVVNTTSGSYEQDPNFVNAKNAEGRPLDRPSCEVLVGVEHANEDYLGNECPMATRHSVEVFCGKPQETVEEFYARACALVDKRRES